MNHFQCLVNDSCAGNERKLRRALRRAIYSCTLSSCMVVVIGCGSAAQVDTTPNPQADETPTVQSQSPTAQDEMPGSDGVAAAANDTSNRPRKEKAEPPKKVAVAPPTA